MRNIIFNVMPFLLIAALFFIGCTRPTTEEQTSTPSQILQAESPDVAGNLSTITGEVFQGIDFDVLAGFPSEDLSPEEINALGEALHHEYMMRATYQKALDTFGDVRPFSGIFASSERNVEAYIILFEKYDLEILKDDWFELIPEFDTVIATYESCKAMEMQSAAVYDELTPMVDNEDILYVFNSIRRVTVEFNVPEFQRYIEGRIE